MIVFDLTSFEFTTLKPYLITRPDKWDWHKAVQVVKDCPVLLEVRVTANDEEDAMIKALYLVRDYIKKPKKKV